MNEKHAQQDHPSLQFTGERFMPEAHGDIELEHLHRYALVCEIIKNKDVLDIASGEGYGSKMMSGSAASVVGVDIDPEAVLHASLKYKAENLKFLEGLCSAIPLEDNSVDIVISFETIEHHDEHQMMMSEIKRVLRPNGVLVISSPDKLEYSDNPGYKNAYHVKELYRDEFDTLLHSFFKKHSIYGQKVLYGSAIFSETSDNLNVQNYELVDGELSSLQGISRPIYLIAVASDDTLPLLSSGVVEQPLEHSELAQQLKLVKKNSDEQIKYRDALLCELKKQLEDVEENASAQIKYRDLLIVEHEQKISEHEQRISEYEQKIDEHEQKINEHEHTIADFEKQLHSKNMVLESRKALLHHLLRKLIGR